MFNSNGFNQYDNFLKMPSGPLMDETMSNVNFNQLGNQVIDLINNLSTLANHPNTDPKYNLLNHPTTHTDTKCDSLNHPTTHTESTCDSVNHPTTPTESTCDSVNHPSTPTNSKCDSVNHPSTPTDSKCDSLNHPSTPTNPKCDSVNHTRNIGIGGMKCLIEIAGKLADGICNVNSNQKCESVNHPSTGSNSVNHTNNENYEWIIKNICDTFVNKDFVQMICTLACKSDPKTNDESMNQNDKNVGIGGLKCVIDMVNKLADEICNVNSENYDRTVKTIYAILGSKDFIELISTFAIKVADVMGNVNNKARNRETLESKDVVKMVRPVLVNNQVDQKKKMMEEQLNLKMKYMKKNQNIECDDIKYGMLLSDQCEMMIMILQNSKKTKMTKKLIKHTLKIKKNIFKKTEK